MKVAKADAEVSFSPLIANYSSNIILLIYFIFILYNFFKLIKYFFIKCLNINSKKYIIIIKLLY